MNEMNCSKLKASSLVVSLLFGWHPISYYQNNVIVYNNTGYAIFGNSHSSSEEQISRNIALIRNAASSGLIGAWRSVHRYINAYVIGNSINNVHFYEPDTSKIIFEHCYVDGTMSGVTEEDKITTMTGSVKSVGLLCSFPNYKLLYESAKRYTKTCKRTNRLYIHLYIIIVSS